MVDIKVEHSQRLREKLSALSPLTDAAWYAMRHHFSYCELDVGNTFVRTGEQATQVGFLLTGSLREYFTTADGADYNKAFLLSGDITGSLYDLLLDQASIATIEAIKPSSLLVANYNAFEKLYDQFDCCQRLGRVIAENLFCHKARREYELLTMDAAQRYACLLSQQPSVEAHVPQYHIASYLGITPVALSRIRKKLKSLN